MKNTSLGWAVLTALTISLPSLAGVTASAGKWQGSGEAFNIEGKSVGSYSVEMVSQAKDEHTLDSRITIHFGDTQESFHQVVTDAGKNRFRITSDQGTGGGLCFGAGLCEGYLGTAAHGYAFTLVLDRPGSRRFLLTKLENGKAIEFLRESHERVE